MVLSLTHLSPADKLFLGALPEYQKKILLQSLDEHTDFLLGFVKKRVELRRLAGAPAPEWQVISDRGDKFRKFQENIRGKVSAAFDAGSDKIIATSVIACILERAKAPRPCTRNRQALTAEIRSRGH
jgi:hypothetical protein